MTISVWGIFLRPYDALSNHAIELSNSQPGCNKTRTLYSPRPKSDWAGSGTARRAAFMDSFELNKIAGGVLFALLILFSTRTMTDIIFTVHAPEKPGYEVAMAKEGGEASGGHAATKEAVPFAQLLKDGDAAKGQKIAKKCAACHTFESGGPNKIGPNLHGIIGRSVASIDGFAYSGPLKSKGGEWSYETLNAFLESPKAYAPGTKMAFAGIKKPNQRADLIIYLRSLGNNPPPLPGN